MAYVRKTTDEFVIQGNHGQGWEDVNTELTRKDGKRSLKEHDTNEARTHRMIVRRVPIESPKLVQS